MVEKTKVSRPPRVVIDTNLVVSALVFRDGRLAWLRGAWEEGRVMPVVSAETVAELLRVLAYPKLKLSEEEMKNALAHYMRHAEAVENVSPSVRIPKCRDPDDRMFLRLAYAARVDALVTGDQNLLAVTGASRIAIITPDALKTKLGT